LPPPFTWTYQIAQDSWQPTLQASHRRQLPIRTRTRYKRHCRVA